MTDARKDAEKLRLSKMYEKLMGKEPPRDVWLGIMFAVDQREPIDLSDQYLDVDSAAPLTWSKAYNLGNNAALDDLKATYPTVFK